MQHLPQDTEPLIVNLGLRVNCQIKLIVTSLCGMSDDGGLR